MAFSASARSACAAPSSAAGRGATAARASRTACVGPPRLQRLARAPAGARAPRAAPACAAAAWRQSGSSRHQRRHDAQRRDRLAVDPGRVASAAAPIALQRLAAPERRGRRRRRRPARGARSAMAAASPRSDASTETSAAASSRASSSRAVERLERDRVAERAQSPPSSRSCATARIPIANSSAGVGGVRGAQRRGQRRVDLRRARPACS